MIKKELLGKPLPRGVSYKDKITNFSIFAANAQSVSLGLFDPDSKKELKRLSLDPKKNRTGDVWHIGIKDLKLPVLYAYFMDGSKETPHFYDINNALLDPYATTIDSPIDWSTPPSSPPMGVLYKEEEFDWEGITRPKLSIKELIVYEMHVRGFTQHESSKVKHKGKFLGLIEKIPYLLDLGVNAIELMPIFEFDETRYDKINPITSKKLCNYWGYSTVDFFMPMNRYATSSEFGKAKEEFKLLVKELHKNKIEVILDVVFNHAGECKGKKEYLSFMGIDRENYYILSNNEDTNYTGCGNTLKLNHPVMQKFVLDCLHYWVLEMQVDGFRFDLATIMNREMNGDLSAQSSLVKSLSLDPILADVKLIAEPWDAASGYQLGGFFPQKKRWSEWNGQYRDNIRKFIKGDGHSSNAFADNIAGSPGLFPKRSPQASVNFITSHDGFSLADLVSHNEKHNEANGESNQDGNNNTISWNCGAEGVTEDLKVLQLRERQRKNFLLALFTSCGVPMLTMGDEYGHSKMGNNNTWCQDNELSWFDWNKLNQNQKFYTFIKKLIQLRKSHPLFSKDKFLSQKEIHWHGSKPYDPNWGDPKPYLGFNLIDKKYKNLFIFFNPSTDVYDIELPKPSKNKKWHLIVNTNAESPDDFYEDSKAPEILTDHYRIQEFTAIVLKEF